jgi:hypothetical protein
VTAGEPYIGVTQFSDAAGNALTVMNVLATDRSSTMPPA